MWLDSQKIFSSQIRYSCEKIQIQNFFGATKDLKPQRGIFFSLPNVKNNILTEEKNQTLWFAPLTTLRAALIGLMQSGVLALLRALNEKAQSALKNSSWLSREVETWQQREARGAMCSFFFSLSFSFSFFPLSQHTFTLRPVGPVLPLQALSRPRPCWWPAAPGGGCASAARRARRREPRPTRPPPPRLKGNRGANPKPSQVSQTARPAEYTEHPGRRIPV